MTAFESPDPDGHPLMQAIRFPETVPHGACHLHVTLVCGLEFLLAVGGQIPRGFDAFCLHHSPDKLVLVRSGEDDPLTRRISALSRQAEVRGALARKE